MKVITTIQDMQMIAAEEKQKKKTVGLVPTMGFLHEGHVSLIHRAREESDFVVMSLFVNPLQFAPNEDFDEYPRDFEKDKRTAEEAGVDILFCPSVEEMYPGNPTVAVSVKSRVDVLCGKSRAGHFDGVATVLTKLFHMIIPDRVFFGMKDAQQAAVVQGLVRDFNFPIIIVPCETIREEDGLAISSRNVHLTKAERKETSALYKSLRHGWDIYRTGERNTERIRTAVSHFLNDCLKSGEIEYVDVLTYPGLEKTEQCNGIMIIALAVQFQKARLIDNIVLGGERNE